MTDEVTIEQVRDRQRFTVHLDGEYAGLTQYVEHGDQRVFIHTVIGDRFEGHGLGGRLVRTALDATREEGRRIVPVCSFVRRYVRDHPDWNDIVDPVTPELLDALPD
ncbi:MAG TPA: GNAT family N-acetyltransferase [Naasia sp.]|jgi:predicted GNAT family acetyltransferase